MRQQLLLFSSGLLMLLLQMACVEFDEPVNNDKPKWEVYTTKDGLPSDTVWSINQDIEKSILIGTQNGVCYIEDSKPNTIKPFDTGFVVHTIACTDESIAIATSLGLLALMDGEWNFYATKNHLIDVKFYNNEIFSLQENGDVFKSIWNPSLNYHEHEYFGMYKLSNSIYVYDNSLWLCRLIGAHKIFPNEKLYSEIDGLASNLCYAIYQDHNNIVWIGTSDEKGLSKIDRGKVINLDCGYIRTITEDINGNIWAGSNFNGLYKIESNGNITNYTMLDGLPNNKITNVFAAKDGTIWVATEGGGIAKHTN